MSEPDLFVVCKNCSSEVSPYVTECPYCGQRVRKRAPKIERRGEEAGQKQRRVRAPSLGRIRRDEIPGIAPDTRPLATIVLLALSLAATVVWSAGVTLDDLGAVLIDPGDEAWRLITTPFIHDNLGYQFVALLSLGIFGVMLERRFGLVTPIAIFALAGAGGAAAAVALDDLPALGANGAALGMLVAWLVEDRLAARRGDDRENDLLGVYVIAIVLLLLPLADEDASVAAGLAGALGGAGAGLILGVFRR
ncbi:MAG: rhomboid family intramembrane serine protease [Thermoleophilaceae bacterium]